MTVFWCTVCKIKKKYQTFTQWQNLDDARIGLKLKNAVFMEGKQRFISLMRPLVLVNHGTVCPVCSLLPVEQRLEPCWTFHMFGKEIKKKKKESRAKTQLRVWTVTHLGRVWVSPL